MMRLVTAALLLQTFTATAGSLGVGPTLLELDAQRRVGALTVRNTGDAATIVQVETVAWHQSTGRDEYEPTDDIAATPEVFELAPGEQRVVRVGQRATTSPASERSYRVYVREVQTAVGAEDARLNFAVRIGVPLFVNAGARGNDYKVTWHLRETTPGCAQLELRNEGRSRQRMHQLELLSDAGVTWTNGDPLYVHAGATRVLDTPVCGTALASNWLRVAGESQTQLLPPGP